MRPHSRLASSRLVCTLNLEAGVEGPEQEEQPPLSSKQAPRLSLSKGPVRAKLRCPFTLCYVCSPRQDKGIQAGELSGCWVRRGVGR